MRVLPSLLCLITTMFVNLPLADAGESERRTLPAPTKSIVAQKSEEGSGMSQGPFQSSSESIRLDWSAT